MRLEVQSAVVQVSLQQNAVKVGFTMVGFAVTVRAKAAKIVVGEKVENFIVCW